MNLGQSCSNDVSAEFEKGSGSFKNISGSSEVLRAHGPLVYVLGMLHNDWVKI